MKRMGVWLAIMALLFLMPMSAVRADGPRVFTDGGRIFVDEDVTLEPGETFHGDLGVFDGDVSVPAGSRVEGDVFVTNGDADIEGQIDGSLAVISGDLCVYRSGQVSGDVFGMSGDQEIAGRVDGDLSMLFGSMELLSSAVVEGDLVVFSGNLEREPGAQVRGEHMSDIPLPRIPIVPSRPTVPPALPKVEPPSLPEVRVPSVPRPETFGGQVGRFMGRTVSAGIFGLLFIAVGLLVAFIWPRPTRKVSDCIAAMPVQGFGLGLLTFLIAAVLEALAAVLMIIVILVGAALISTVILIPVGLLLILLSVLVLLPVPLAVAGAMVLGWVALAELVGRKALRVLRVRDARPVGAVLVGLLITVSLAAMLWVLQPGCCAWPFIILLTSVGVGATIHTRFGRESCQQSLPPAESDLLPAEAMDEEAGAPDMG